MSSTSELLFTQNPQWAQPQALRSITIALLLIITHLGRQVIAPVQMKSSKRLNESLKSYGQIVITVGFKSSFEKFMLSTVLQCSSLKTQCFFKMSTANTVNIPESQSESKQSLLKYHLLWCSTNYLCKIFCAYAHHCLIRTYTYNYGQSEDVDGIQDSAYSAVISKTWPISTFLVALFPALVLEAFKKLPGAQDKQVWQGTSSKKQTRAGLAMVLKHHGLILLD